MGENKPEIPLNATECTFSNKGEEGGPTCENPPVYHILWIDDLPEIKVSNACHFHMQYVLEKARERFETHDFRGDCGMPGALWHRAHTHDESYCIFPTEVPDDLSAMAFAPEPVKENDLHHISSQ